jgi:hypothetical protein
VFGNGRVMNEKGKGKVGGVVTTRWHKVFYGGEC